MDEHEIKGLIEKLQSGQCNETERALLETWYLQRDRQGISDLSETEFLEDLALISEGLPLHQPVRRLWWPRVAAVAAILAVFVMIYIEWPARQSRVHPVQLTTLAVPAGGKQQITLADGSQVWINAGSDLKYPALFNGTTREVY